MRRLLDKISTWDFPTRVGNQKAQTEQDCSNLLPFIRRQLSEVSDCILLQLRVQKAGTRWNPLNELLNSPLFALYPIQMQRLKGKEQCLTEWCQSQSLHLNNTYVNSRAKPSLISNSTTQHQHRYSCTAQIFKKTLWQGIRIMQCNALDLIESY